MKRIFWLIVATALTAIFYYLSRFWSHRFWDRDGLLGFKELRPQGGLVDVWLRGTQFQPFELIIWAIGIFILLTWVQKLYDLFSRSE